MDGQTDKLIEELNAINRQAFDMAVLVLKDPILRHSLAHQAIGMRDRLFLIAGRLKKMVPNIYQQWSDQISESILDLNFIEKDLDIVSLRLGHMIKKEKSKSQNDQNQYETSFPLPENVQNFSRVLKSDLISFQTSLSLEEITQFYREAFRRQGLIEDGLITNMSEEHISLAFLGLPDERMVVVQAIDLGYKTEQDLRYVSLRTEKGPSLSGSDIEGFQRGKRIQLVEDRRETFTYIYVEVIGTGDLLMAASRAGEDPRKYLDQDSFGYWLIVSCGQKERVVKALIKKLYGENASVTPELQAILEGKGDLEDSDTLDNLLLHLIEKLYKGNPLAVQEFIALLKANGIDYDFHTEAQSHLRNE